MSSETLSTEGVGAPRKTVLSLLEDGDLLLVQDGNHGGNYPAQSDFVEFGGIPLITGADIERGLIDISGSKQITTEKASQLRVGIAQEGDLLLTHKGTMGKTAVIPAIDAPFIVVNPQITIYRVNPKGSIDTRFLKYFFDSPGFQEYLNRISSTSTVSTLSITNQKHLEIPCPSIEDQGRISNLLGTLDDKIKLNRKTNETLEGIAKVLFKSWFVDFDPVRAKAEGRPTGLPDEISELFPDSFHESEQGEIPDGWSTCGVDEAAVWMEGKPWKKEQRVDASEVLTFGANGVIGHSINAMGEGRVIFVGKIGSCGAINNHNGKYWATNNTFLLSEDANPHLEFVRQLLGRVDFSLYVGGSSNPYMPLKNFGGHAVINPPSVLINQFCQRVTSLRQRIELAEHQSKSLGLLRDALLPRLISGELRVPDAEKMLDEVGI